MCTNCLSFTLQGFRAKQSSTKQQIHKSQQAIQALEQEAKSLQEDEALLTRKLARTEADAVERYERLRQLVQQHCAQTGETWSEDDLERVLLEDEGVHKGAKSTNAELFFAILPAAGRPEKPKLGRTKSLFSHLNPHVEGEAISELQELPRA